MVVNLSVLRMKWANTIFEVADELHCETFNTKNELTAKRESTQKCRESFEGSNQWIVDLSYQQWKPILGNTFVKEKGIHRIELTIMYRTHQPKLVQEVINA